MNLCQSADFFRTGHYIQMFKKLPGSVRVNKSPAVINYFFMADKADVIN